MPCKSFIKLRNAIIVKITIDHLEYLINEDGDILNQRMSGFVVAPLDKDGYKRFRNKYIHRLVYEAFVGPIPEGMTIDHIDGNKVNNHLSNLQLMGRGKNSQKGNSKKWSVISPEGEVFHIENMEDFCKNNGLHAGHMRSVASCKLNYKSHKGWRKSHE